MVRTAARWKARKLPDFAVALQPFMRQAPLAASDMDSADCFHPNLASHRGMAVALWNNMLAGSWMDKGSNFKQGQNVTCPSAASRLAI